VGRVSGQGLAVAWNVLEKHNANITFETVVGEGSTFSVRLPSSSMSALQPQRASTLGVVMT
jgi:light-regulated signal transduction histidine kinase (bacteriophytochrome)